MDPIENILLKSLNASWTRQEALANNIANAETPGYARKDIDFQAELSKILDSTVDGGTYESKITENPAEKVQVEKEIGEIAKNTMFYDSIAKFASLRQRILDATVGGS